ncbi:MAG: acyltransferase [Mesorhizobium sp.]|uniref:acyltransferase family protein n=1 Tax=unclassified Mesorhizobium TaxID=325217 RepID=UPI000FCC2878|nr:MULTISPECIES: acyltransferase family protein [unclassified Mesorhizobium]RUV65219.1 acyltransferase [Mesorhizobium sp. M5C.F.Ca.IN.020.29.1.1]TIM87659.1 MAG: acyltransferase [Mesorhizobium sp.]TIR33290.1 MAG: acyltransferase [Mesorhizobium sp.]
MHTKVGSADSHVMAYRPDVDGLRAVAVISVIAFHLSPSWLPGGYLGVDVFFVLSGYLITLILWREALNGQFSILRFYERRIRRIMPALLLVLFFATIAAAMLLLPADLIGYGKSMLATLGFVANIYFWRDTDYFSRAAEAKPLLHVWSLGVEEQFYILFPLLIAAFARFWPRATFPAITLLTVLSLAANYLALRFGGASPAFFLLPTRAWELGAGAMIALLPLRLTPRGTTANLLGAIGAVAILIGIISPAQVYAFVPVALPVVVGAMLVIAAGRVQQPLANRLIAAPPLVFVGLISYSLYLWHWPIIVFSQYYLIRELNIGEMVIAVAVMSLGAYASWRYVERPFRSKFMPARTVCLAAAGGAGALAVIASVLIWSNGMPGRMSGEAAAINAAVGTNYRCPVSNYVRMGQSRACVLNLPSRDPSDANVVLLGNSHAQMYAPVWQSIFAERNMAGLLVPANGCLPTVSVNISRSCIDVAAANLAELGKLPNVRTVILGLTWEHARLVDATGKKIETRHDAELVRGLDDLIARLRAFGKKVVLIGPIAYPGWDLPSDLSRSLAFGRPLEAPTYLPVAKFQQQYGPAIQHFEAQGIGFVRPDKVLCDASRCNYLLDGRSMFADASHIAEAELFRFRAIFAEALID